MNSVKKTFSIRDMENLSGIKAHTIRIWEKRYNLLRPERTDTNIRTYSLSSLQKLLNVTLLYNHGYKISKIATISESDIPKVVSEIALSNNRENQAMNALKLAMVNFDQNLFSKTYESLLSKKTFREVFYEMFIPLLNELGLLWQTDTISPSHEHFITNLIKQKIYGETEKLQSMPPRKSDRIFALFLPENEIHELGLLYVNYEIVSKGYKSIYLGQSTPVVCLTDLLKYYESLHFISYFTVSPTKEKLEKYIQQFTKILGESPKSRLWLLGHQIQYLPQQGLSPAITTFDSIEQVTSALN